MSMVRDKEFRARSRLVLTIDEHQRSQSHGKSDARDADVRTPSLRDTSHLAREHELREVQAAAAHG